MAAISSVSAIIVYSLKPTPVEGKHGAFRFRVSVIRSRSQYDNRPLGSMPPFDAAFLHLQSLERLVPIDVAKRFCALGEQRNWCDRWPHFVRNTTVPLDSDCHCEERSDNAIQRDR